MTKTIKTWQWEHLTPKQKEAARVAQRKKDAQETFLGFARYLRPGLRVNKHHRILASYLERFYTGEIPRLMIFAPPRHGKSEFISRIGPAYKFSRDPYSKIIACSYSARLAQKMNVDCQRLMLGENWPKVFPEHGLGSDNVRSGSFRAKRNSDEFELQENASGLILGSYTCAGAGGSVTGFGADYAIIDDPVKDAAAANSATQRESLWDWYNSTLYTRLQDPGSVLIMHTRWHEDDLAGRLLAQAAKDPEADQWVVVNLPAMYEPGLPGLVPEDVRNPGDALWPARFDVTKLKKIRANLGPRWWNALYQGTPKELEGTLFRRDWVNYYNSTADFGGLPALRAMAFSADLAFDGDPDSDYVVFQAWGMDDKRNFYLLDQARGQWDFVDSLRALEQFRERWPMIKQLYLEKKANGSAMLSSLKKQFRSDLKIIPVIPDKNKVLRFFAVQPVFESGRVYLPARAHFLEDYMKELTAVRPGPRGQVQGAKNDDQVDTTTQLLLQWTAGGEVDPLERLKAMQLLTGIS